MVCLRSRVVTLSTTRWDKCNEKLLLEQNVSSSSDVMKSSTIGAKFVIIIRCNEKLLLKQNLWSSDVMKSYYWSRICDHHRRPDGKEEAISHNRFVDRTRRDNIYFSCSVIFNWRTTFGVATYNFGTYENENTKSNPVACPIKSQLSISRVE
jgi:hypothetical protein